MAKDQTVLFHSTIFGPIHSRRLGTSLGVNLMPVDGKVCSFDCLYCEAGYNAQGRGKAPLPTAAEVGRLLSEKLQAMRQAGEHLDVITFSGNGEPTLHPQFPEIIDLTLSARDRYYPEAKVSVLSNSTRIFDPAVAAALRKVDNNILKLDSAVEDTMRLIDRPGSKDFTVKSVTEALRQFKGQAIIQTMLLRGQHEGQPVDNTTPAEVEALIEAYRTIQPREVMLYSIDRSTPEEQLRKVPRQEIEAIAQRVEEAGIKTQVN